MNLFGLASQKVSARGGVALIACYAPFGQALQKKLDTLWQQKLRETHDDFQPAAKYIEKWHYVTDANGTVRYAP